MSRGRLKSDNSQGAEQPMVARSSFGSVRSGVSGVWAGFEPPGLVSRLNVGVTDGGGRRRTGNLESAAATHRSLVVPEPR